MISLKKYLDLGPTNPISAKLSPTDLGRTDLSPVKKEDKQLDPGPDELFSSALGSYRRTLTAMGDCSVQVCPALGSELQENLTGLGGQLSEKVTASLLRKTEEQVAGQLHQWGGRATDYFKQKACEVKEVLMVLARTAESVAERDQRYTSQFGQFTARLQAMANLEDLTEIRAAVVRTAMELKSCTDKMAQDGRESVAQLRAKVLTYEDKLADAEQRATRDPLTGLENRDSIEKKIQRRIAEQRTFSLMMVDLNGFKQINDLFGHLAGNDLLKQFAKELRWASRATDIVGRWGGDEFVVLLDCGLPGAKAHLERLQKWLFGEYDVQVGTETRKVPMDASIGVAEWQGGETMNDVLGRADAAMYQQKKVAKKAAKR